MTKQEHIETENPDDRRRLCKDAPPCSQYIPFMEIPEEIHAAIQTIHLYFEKQGMREWEFSHIADRRLVTKLERERDEVKAANATLIVALDDCVMVMEHDLRGLAVIQPELRQAKDALISVSLAKPSHG